MHEMEDGKTTRTATQSEIGSETKTRASPVASRARIDPEIVYVKYVYIPYISSVDMNAQKFALRVDYDLFWRATEKDLQIWERLSIEEKKDYTVDPKTHATLDLIN